MTSKNPISTLNIEHIQGSFSKTTMVDGKIWPTEIKKPIALTPPTTLHRNKYSRLNAQSMPKCGEMTFVITKQKNTVTRGP